MYDVIYRKSAIKARSKMTKSTARNIIKKITKLAANPHAQNNNIKKLKGRDGYRLRVGDYRVFYDIIDKQLIIEVIDILPRGDAYK